MVPAGPHHVLARDVGVVARLPELLPRLRLVHAQGGEIRRAADLHPRGANGVRQVTLLVLVDDGPVARVLELGRVGRCAPRHRDLLGDDRHGFPLAPVAVLVGIVRVGLVDVEVLTVGAEDREPPGPVLVVADGDAREARLASTDDVPPRPHQVDPVAEGGRALGTVGIVGHHRIAALRAAPVHHPVVRSDVLLHVVGDGSRRLGGRRLQEGEGVLVTPVLVGDDVLRLEVDASPEGVVDAEDVLGKRLPVDGRIELQLRIAGTEGLQLLHGLGAHRRDPPTGGELGADVAHPGGARSPPPGSNIPG